MSGQKLIQIITGSRSDLFRKDEKGEEIKTELSDRIDALKAKYDGELSISTSVCSGEKTPQMLASVMNAERADAFIFAGAYSLPLAARGKEALSELIACKTVSNAKAYTATFFREKDLRGIAPIFRTYEDYESESLYHGSGSFIPVVAVPMRDSKSGGLSAWISVVEQPSYSDPRPAVALGNIETAVESIRRMYATKFESIFIGPEGEEYNTAKSVLNRLGIEKSIITNEAEGRQDTINILFPTNMPDVDRYKRWLLYPTQLLVCSSCIPDRIGMLGNYNPISAMKAAERLGQGLNVGMASPENAAILAAQIYSLSHPEMGIMGNVREMLHKRAAESGFGIKR